MNDKHSTKQQSKNQKIKRPHPNFKKRKQEKKRNRFIPIDSKCDFLKKN
jgi:hypothetical protein